jgi:DEAD/DEAH box helicase domain-containing protein
MCSMNPYSGGWPGAILDQWKHSVSTGSLVAVETGSPSEALTAEFPAWMPLQIVNGLKRSGITAPYSHQAQAWELLEDGRNTVIATPTASGKTLCYNVPAMSRLAENKDAVALYLFPTKALARDQEQATCSFAAGVGVKAEVFVYDGDTPGAARRVARDRARILISNPDMLHTGILPHHASWARFFAGISLIVIDELHVYRGVFGSHVANVLRRLLRVASFYGAKPNVVACSATIRNPLELAQRVVGLDFSLVDTNGASAGARTFAIFNPALVNPELGIRRSVLKETARLASRLVAAKKKVIVFCRSRRGVEIVLRYLKNRITGFEGDPSRIRGYRGGYLPALRREIESSLKNGELDAVVATNALELGIDIGSLDAVVLAGYPGTVAGLHQRSGRAGRRKGASLSLLITSSDPLDQFLAREPHYLFGATPESAMVQPDNVDVLLGHLRCAAFELPFLAGDRFGTLRAEDNEAALDCLVEEGTLTLSKGKYFFIDDSYPAADFSLRSIEAKRIVAVDLASDRPIAQVDWHSARRELHNDAVYQHEGVTYQVERLDMEKERAYVREVEPTYYTIAVCDVKIDVTDQRESKPCGSGLVVTGEVEVKENITGYKKVRFYTHENLGYGDVVLPPSNMDTEATWFVPASTLVGRLGATLFQRGLEGFGYALHQVAALRLMCDPKDLEYTVEIDPNAVGEDIESPQMVLFLYDAHAGGVGLAERAYDKCKVILKDTLGLVSGCTCSGGCPSCLGPSEAASPRAKDAVVAVAKSLLKSMDGMA